MAEYIVPRQQEDGSFFILGDTPTRENFALDKIEIDIEKPFLLNLVNNIFHHDDFEKIQALLEDYNRNYLYAAASGSWLLYDRAHFTGDDIYQEVNARSLYMIFHVPDAGLGCERGVFSYRLDDLRIDGDWAKVILTRSAETIDEDPRSEEADCSTVIEDAVREGYLLQKVDGDWTIANIIFAETERWSGDPDRIFNDTYTEVNMLNLFADAVDAAVWQKGFTFDKCQRGDYSPYGNFMSYIQGPIEAPVFLYEKLAYERDDPSATLAGWQAMQDGAVQ